MSTQSVQGFAKTSTGGVPLQTTLTDGSNSSELQTDQTYSITSQSLGTFKEGATLTHLQVSSSTGIAFCGVLRNGQYIAICQSMGSNALGGAPQSMPVLPGPIQLVAGDQVICRVES